MGLPGRFTDLPLTVGRNLAWDTWHTIELVLRPPDGTQVSLTVDGAGQDPSVHAVPRFSVDGQWQQAEDIDSIECDVVSSDSGDPVQETDDGFRVDNLDVSVEFLEAPDFRFVRIYRGLRTRELEVVHETIETSWHDPDGTWEHVDGLAGDDAGAGPRSRGAARRCGKGPPGGPSPVRLPLSITLPRARTPQPACRRSGAPG